MASEMKGLLKMTSFSAMNELSECLECQINVPTQTLNKAPIITSHITAQRNDLDMDALETSSNMASCWGSTL